MDAAGVFYFISLESKLVTLSTGLRNEYGIFSEQPNRINNKGCSPFFLKIAKL